MKTFVFYLNLLCTPLWLLWIWHVPIMIYPFGEIALTLVVIGYVLNA